MLPTFAGVRHPLYPTEQQRITQWLIE